MKTKVGLSYECNGTVLVIKRTNIDFPGRELVFYLNLSGEKQKASGVADSKSQWINALSKKIIKKANKSIKLKPWSYLVISK
jgi:hypothetical protein